MAKINPTVMRKPKAPMMSLQELLGNTPATGPGFGPPMPAAQGGMAMGPPTALANPGWQFGGPSVAPVPPAPVLSPSLQAMMGAGMGAGPEMTAGMTGARERGLLRERTQDPGPMPGMPPAGPPAPAPGVARVAPGMAPYQPPGMPPAGALTPDAKAIIDAMTGKRVHKGLGGQQLGMEGVNPALKYMLYAQRGRRHIGFGGKEIY